MTVEYFLFLAVLILVLLVAFAGKKSAVRDGITVYVNETMRGCVTSLIPDN